MRLKADLLLFLVTILWGSAFVVMRLAAGHGTAFILNGFRFLLGGLLLLPFVRLKGAFNRKNLVYIGLAGLALYAAAAFQQLGLATTSAGNAGFITSLYVVFVPIVAWMLWRQPPSMLNGVAVLLAIAGGFLLSTRGSFQFRQGDFLIFVSSFFWALHVIIVGRGQGKIEPLPFALGQFILCGVLSLVTGAIVEHPTLAVMRIILPAILYTGIFSVALGFTMQIVAQKHTPPTDAALILSLEAVFAAFFGGLFLHEVLLPVQMAGCALILGAVVFVQLSGKARRYASQNYP